MACSRFEYVKAFERHERLLPGCWVVIRLDGRSFTKFSKKHEFRKPNDERALKLCNEAAKTVMSTFDDHIIFAYGESDEYSFVMKRESMIFSRRESKILSTVVSLFTSAYVFHWSRFMHCPLLEPPSFDGRVVLYPTTKHLRDYLSWRQADTHVNNLFNTTFWSLVMRGGKTQKEAEALLKGTLAKDKNEILFGEFGINYNNEPEIFRKGSFIMKNPETRDSTGRFCGGKRRRVEDRIGTEATGVEENMLDVKSRETLVVLHVDIIADEFWNEHPELLAPSDLDPPRIRKAK